MEISVEDLPPGSTEAKAIAVALSNHLGRSVRLVTRDGGETVASANAPGQDRRRSIKEEEPATERERRIIEDVQDILRGGPERGHEKLEKLGKYFVRDRLDLIFDEILFEDGTFAKYDEDERLPGDAMITGAGRINGRKVYFMANDYTVKAGTVSDMSSEKWIRIQEKAMETGDPILYLIDSSGGRIDEQDTYYANRYLGGKMLFNQCIMSGEVPQIAVLYGPDFAGTAYQPVLCDVLIMVEDISAMAIASPRIVEMVTGEQTSIDNLGSPDVHAEHSGSVDFVVQDENEAATLVNDLLGFLPQNYQETPPNKQGQPPAEDPTEIDIVIPDNPNRPYDVHQLIDRLMDEDSFYEFKPRFGKEIITGWGRLDGRPVGVIANQPAVKSGAIYPDSSEKAAGFIWLCDAYNIPLLYLCDTPGFMVGEQVERDAILQKGRRFLFATASVTVPKISVIVRKGYGAGTYVMSAPAFETDSVLGLPSSQIAVMGPKAAVNAVYRRKIEEIDDPEERQAYIERKKSEYRENIDIKKLASQMIVDELIPPRDLRPELINRFDAFEDRDKKRPGRKHGTMLF